MLLVHLVLVVKVIISQTGLNSHDATDVLGGAKCCERHIGGKVVSAIWPH